MNTNDYLDGMRDCKNGWDADPTRSADYQRGYGTQYQHEQNVTELSLLQERIKENGK